MDGLSDFQLLELILRGSDTERADNAAREFLARSQRRAKELDEAMNEKHKALEDLEKERNAM
jgi:hypothetical protein